MRLAMFIALLGALAGLVGRGSLANLTRLRFRALPLLLVFAVGTLVARTTLPGSFALLLVGMAAFTVFAGLNALPVPGMALVALGLGLNFVVTANNGGMPYRPSAVVSAGVVSKGSADLVPIDNVTQHAERKSDQLMMFADVIPLRPLREVVSIGDILVALGIGLVVFSAVSRRSHRHGTDDVIDVSARSTALQKHAANTSASKSLNTESLKAKSPESLMPESAGTVPVDDAVAAGAPHNMTSAAVVSLADGRVRPDPLDEKIRLLKATGDVSVVIDLAHNAGPLLHEQSHARIGSTSPAPTSNENLPSEEIARFAVARALAKSHSEVASGDAVAGAEQFAVGDDARSVALSEEAISAERKRVAARAELDPARADVIDLIAGILREAETQR